MTNKIKASTISASDPLNPVVVSLGHLDVISAQERVARLVEGQGWLEETFERPINEMNFTRLSKDENDEIELIIKGENKILFETLRSFYPTVLHRLLKEHTFESFFSAYLTVEEALSLITDYYKVERKKFEKIHRKRLKSYRMKSK